MAVSRLAGNEKLLSALAWRLGIPRENITADGREPSLARGDGHDTDIDVDGAGGGDSMGEGGNEEGGLSANERVKDDRTEDEEEISENREQVEVRTHQRVSSPTPMQTVTAGYQVEAEPMRYSRRGWSSRKLPCKRERWTAAV